MDTCFGGLFNIRIFNKIDQWEFAIFILCMISLVAVWLDRNPSETWLLIVCSLSCILDLYLLFKMVTFDCKSSTILFLSHWQKQIMQILMNHQFRSVLSCYRDKIPVHVTAWLLKSTDIDMFHPFYEHFFCFNILFINR